MKKVIVLLLAMVLCVGLLAACTSADPNHPYGQDPAPKNGTTSVVTAMMEA